MFAAEKKNYLLMMIIMMLRIRQVNYTLVR